MSLHLPNDLLLMIDMNHLLVDSRLKVGMVSLGEQSCDLNRVVQIQSVLVELIELAPNDLIGQREVDLEWLASILTNQNSFGVLSDIFSFSRFHPYRINQFLSLNGI